MNNAKNLMRQLDSESNSSEPALLTGGTVTSIAAIITLINVFFPNLMTVQQSEALYGCLSILLPVATAWVIRGRVWSPRSVKDVVAESVSSAIDVSKAFDQNVERHMDKRSTDPGDPGFIN